MVATINASVSSSGIVSTADGSGILKVQSNGVTTNALAWISFTDNGSSTSTRSSFNVSSITRNATSDYTINFSTNMADANYCAVGMSGFNSTSQRVINQPYNLAAPSVSSCRFVITSSDGVLGSIGSPSEFISVAIFGN